MGVSATLWFLSDTADKARISENDDAGRCRHSLIGEYLYQALTKETVRVLRQHKISNTWRIRLATSRPGNEIMNKEY